MSLNRVVLVGRMTKDADLRYTPSGVAVANGTIAVNRPFKNQQGENEADFINFVVWRKQAENLANYTGKGSLIGIDGRIQTRSYEGQDGKRVYITEVLAENIQYLDTRNKSTQQQRINVANENVQKNAEPFPNDGQQIDINDDDLPF